MQALLAGAAGLRLFAGWYLRQSAQAVATGHCKPDRAGGSGDKPRLKQQARFAGVGDPAPVSFPLA
jgi:hypothetical protein